jgi:hypothetical protein
MKTLFKVFFCHKSSDKERVRELKESLKNLFQNFPIKDVAEDVPYVDDWKVAASPILKSCDLLVCVVGEDTCQSEPVDWEIREAYGFNNPIIITTLDKKFKLPSACQDLRIESVPWDADEVAGQIGEMLLHRALFIGHDWSTGVPQQAVISQQYNIMVQSWESLIARRQTVNTVYTTASSALLAGIGLLLSFVDKVGFGWTAAAVTVMAFLGTALSYNWRRTIISYGILSKAKYRVVEAFEKYMPAQMFDAEWRVLEVRRYKSTTAADQETAFFFILLYVTIFLIAGGITIGKLTLTG